MAYSILTAFFKINIIPLNLIINLNANIYDQKNGIIKRWNLVENKWNYILTIIIFYHLSAEQQTSYYQSDFRNANAGCKPHYLSFYNPTFQFGCPLLRPLSPVQ